MSRSISIVIPAFNVDYCLPAVLDALVAQTSTDFEVIVVDDTSQDTTISVARTHPVVDHLIRLPKHLGAAAARNVGTLLASGQTVVYLDADMVIPSHVITELAVRTRDDLVLLGFRDNVPSLTGDHLPDLRHDHRVRWCPSIDRQLMYSGITLTEPIDGRPLDHTHDLRDLGFGRMYHDWDLPRMVVTALLAVPRRAVVDVGGFELGFNTLGWGMEDTHLGAKLIAAGLLVVPVRHVVGFHLDPPDADAQWQTKLATWPATLRLYRALLEQPAPIGCADDFTNQMSELLSCCEVLR